jgi:2-keto-4-pentenoate hydratase
MSQNEEHLPMHHSASDIADAFVAARHAGTAIAAYPGAVPKFLPEAYATQALAIERWPDDIGGWKVARINDPWRDRLQANRYLGPVFARTIVEAGLVSKVPVYEGGSAAFEAEIGLVLGRDADPERRSWSIDDARALIGSTRLVVEAASSPLASMTSLGPAAAITAFGNNSGLILGRSVDLEALPGALVDRDVDGNQVGHAPLWGDADGPLPAFVFALKQATALGRPLKRGQVISTGALTGVHKVEIGQECTARFGDFANIICVVTARSKHT